MESVELIFRYTEITLTILLPIIFFVVQLIILKNFENRFFFIAAEANSLSIGNTENTLINRTKLRYPDLGELSFSLYFAGIFYFLINLFNLLAKIDEKFIKNNYFNLILIILICICSFCVYLLVYKLLLNFQISKYIIKNIIKKRHLIIVERTAEPTFFINFTNFYSKYYDLRISSLCGLIFCNLAIWIASIYFYIYKIGS